MADAVAGLMAGMPKFNLGGDLIWWIIGTIFFVVVFAGIVGVSYWYMSFNQKIVIFRKVAGVVRSVGRDRAKAVRVSKTGDFLWFCRKAKKWLNRPTLEVAPKTWWFFIREDGEWINFIVDDIDSIMKKAGVFYIHEDMRMSRIANSKLLQERYEQQTFMQKWGAMLIGIGVLVIIIILLVLLVDKGMVLADKLNGIIQSADLILQRAQNIQTGGASLVPVK